LVIGKEPEALKLKPGVHARRPQPADINKWVEMAEPAAASVQIYQAPARNRHARSREAARRPLPHHSTWWRHARPHSRQQLGWPGCRLRQRQQFQHHRPAAEPADLRRRRRVSKDREAVALKEKAAADLDNARRTAALNARQAYLGVTAGMAQVKAYEAALTSSQSALDSNKLGYEVGVRINIDVLNAQSQLYDTRQKLARQGPARHAGGVAQAQGRRRQPRRRRRGGRSRFWLPRAGCRR
jgi:outer membrane protein